MLRYCIVLYVFLNCISLVAGEVKDLYSAKVVVASQSKNDRLPALKQAMRAVLVKVGGHIRVLAEPQVKSQLRRANSYVSNYRYERVGDDLFLVAQFQATKINDLFVAANLSLWGSLRPQVVIWFVNEQGLSREIIAASSPSEFPQVIADFASQRGLPIVLPLVDLIDLNTLSSADVWGRFLGPISEASNRYLADVIVTVRLSNSSLLPTELLNTNCQLLCQPVYALDWSTISTVNGEFRQEFGAQKQGTEAKTLLLSALDEITNKMYATYALSTDSSKEYLIDVANVDSLRSYVEVTNFLQSLTSVRAVTLVSASASQRRFSLSLFGSEQALLASLKLNGKLQQYKDPLKSVNPEDVPVFYWGK
jgi:hypothetical protein